MIFNEKIIPLDSSTIPNKNIKGVVQLVESNDISFDFVTTFQKDIIEMPVKEQEDHIELHFEIQGITDFNSTYNQNIKTIMGRYSFFYEPEIEGTIQFIPFKKKRKSIGIEFSKRYLEKLFQEPETIFGSFWDNINKQKNDCWIDNGIIDNTIITILSEIENCTYFGELKTLFIQSKINELLCHIINNKHQNLPVQQSISKKNEIERLYFVKELVEQNIEKPLTNKAISERIGISETKLRVEFKKLFGITIYQYLIKLRMQKAKQLLLETDLTITEIAYKIGYKNATHFTSAFKQVFGFLPSSLKF